MLLVLVLHLFQVVSSIYSGYNLARTQFRVNIGLKWLETCENIEKHKNVSHVKRQGQLSDYLGRREHAHSSTKPQMTRSESVIWLPREKRTCTLVNEASSGKVSQLSDYLTSREHAHSSTKPQATRSDYLTSREHAHSSTKPQATRSDFLTSREHTHSSTKPQATRSDYLTSREHAQRQRVPAAMLLLCCVHSNRPSNSTITRYSTGALTIAEHIKTSRQKNPFY